MRPTETTLAVAIGCAALLAGLILVATEGNGEQAHDHLDLSNRSWLDGIGAVRERVGVVPLRSDPHRRLRHPPREPRWPGTKPTRR